MTVKAAANGSEPFPPDVRASLHAGGAPSSFRLESETDQPAISVDLSKETKK